MAARSCAADGEPCDGPLPIGLDSNICETHGLCKKVTQHLNYAGVRDDHPLFAIAAGTSDVMTARLGKGRAHTARGTANCL